MVRPRCGKLKDIHRSPLELTEYEEQFALNQFNRYVEVDSSDSIQRDEVRSILINLNLDASQLVLDDYLDAHNLDLGADSSRSGETFSWESFRALYVLILKNQTGYFREIYNGKDPKTLDINSQLKDNTNNIRICFDVYDVDKSGYLSFMELKMMLMEMNLHK
tara:strand:- start:171 stop:659 length:489 start_codon:yes stop_codon:yes gene_type:complete